MRVAFVHDWLVTFRGGEKVLEALLELYPEAPVYTLFYEAKGMPDSIRSRDLRYSPWLNRLRPLRKLLLPILPAAIESMPLEDYDLVISTSSCVAKGVLVSPHAKHFCYIHSPMRYIWDQRRHYLTPKREFSWKEVLIHLFFTQLRMWDIASNQGVDRFIANSHFIRKRVQRYYRRDCGVIPPPVAVDRFVNHGVQKKPYFLAAGAFVSYKRFDLAIEACRKAGKELVIAGSGPLEASLRKRAQGQVRLIVNPDQKQWVQLFQEAQALIFPGVEDFGITAIEAMAAGTPVIAYREGGALDFIEEGKTGCFFQEAHADSLAKILQDFDAKLYAPEYLQKYAQNYSKERFLNQIRLEIAKMLEHEGIAP